MKKIIERILKILARGVLKRQKPQVVTITGSLGKTSAKEAIYFALRQKFNARRSLKNYNNELGVPLTILGEPSPGKCFLGWLKVFLKGLFLIFFKKRTYPQVLILEMAAEKPGDLEYLMEILEPRFLRAAVLTAIAPVHLEFFGSMENVWKEKLVPFSFLKPDSWAIFNKDMCSLEKVFPNLSSKILTYGIEKQAAVSAENLKINKQGIEFNLVYKAHSLPFFLKGAISWHQIYPLLAGFAVGLSFEIKPTEILQALKKYQILLGRLRRIKGVKGSLIIDDTYNSSPIAAKKALKAITNLPFGKRKIAVLGDMLELGKFSQKFHQEVGKLAAQLKVDYLITFGKEAGFILEGAIKNGMENGRGFKFNELAKVVAFLKSFMEEDDIILIKGSQGTRMERIVKELMAEPEKAKHLLVRQTKEWQKCGSQTSAKTTSAKTKKGLFCGCLTSAKMRKLDIRKQTLGQINKKMAK